MARALHVALFDASLGWRLHEVESAAIVASLRGKPRLEDSELPGVITYPAAADSERTCTAGAASLGATHTDTRLSEPDRASEPAAGPAQPQAPPELPERGSGQASEGAAQLQAQAPGAPPAGGEPTAGAAPAAAGDIEMAAASHEEEADGGGGGESDADSGAAGEGDDAPPNDAAWDPQCCYCDDGGDLLACDGPCMRSFHCGGSGEEGPGGAKAWVPDPDACNPLGMGADLGEQLCVKSLRDSFLCPNCLAGVHQCFVCKKEGKAGVDVYRCTAASCGHFYHHRCIGAEPGQPFLCGLHTCACEGCAHGSEGGEGAGDAGELVVCRRCPKAYHVACIPRVLTRQGGPRRVWIAGGDGEPTEVERSLLYCGKHKIHGDEGTPRHVRPPFAADLLRAWHRHYAERYPHLPSSAALLAQEAAAERARAPAKAAISEGSTSSSDSEDVPLLQRSKAQAARAGQKQPGRARPPQPPGRSRERSPALPAAQKHDALAAAAADARAWADDGPSSSGEPSPKKKRRVAASSAAPAGGAPAAARRAAAPGAAGAEPEAVPPEELRRGAEALLRAARAAITRDTIEAGIQRPQPYDNRLKKTVEEGRLASLQRAVQFAAQRWEASRDPGLVRAVMDASSTRDVLRWHDTLATALAPFLHGDRYSSYGRHFTDPDLLAAVVDRLVFFMRPGDQVVDFSCGANVFVPMVKARCRGVGLAVAGRAYDVILARDTTDFSIVSWFDVRAETAGLAPADRLVIGLNPPFGMNNVLANKFVEHAAAEFVPRLMVLIVPPGTVVPPGYCVVFEDRAVCARERFSVPGSRHKSWNKDVPALRILARGQAAQELLCGADSLGWETLPPRGGP